MKAELKWLEDPRIFRINRLDAHSDHMYTVQRLRWRPAKADFCRA